MSLSDRFDITFQSRMLSLAVQQPYFLAHYTDVFSSSLFSSNYHKDIASWLLSHYRKYRSLPSLVSMKKILRDNVPSSDPLYKGYKTLVDQIYSTEVLDHEYVKDQFVTAAKFQSLKGALLRMADQVDAGDFDSLSKTLNAALQVGSGAGDLGLDLRSSFDKTLMLFNMLEETIPIGFPKLEKYTGGIFAGELTSVVAPAGRGKTAVLGSIALGVARKNQSNVYYTLEIRDRRLLLRMYAQIAKMPIRELELQKAKAKDRLKIFQLSTKGTALVKFWPSGSINVETIRSHLMKCYGAGIKPSAIFVDYADLLKPSRFRDRPDLEITDMYRDMRALGSEFNLHVFTASQAKYEAWGREILEMGSSAESQGKETTVDNWISVNRTVGEEKAGVGRLFIGKARMEKSGRIVHVAMDLEKMSIYEIDVDKYIFKMKKAGQKVSDKGRPIQGIDRKQSKSEELDAHYSS